MGTVIFNPTTWKLRYPEFVAVPDDLAQLYFDEAGTYLNNSPVSVVRDDATRAVLLNMLTAHVAAIAGQTSADPSSAMLVGPMTNVSEGSVSAGTTLQVPGTAAWFYTTKYGLAYWQATARYRTFRYRTPNQPFAQATFPFPQGFNRRW